MKKLLLLLLLSGGLYKAAAQGREVYAIGFYNLENLFDTEADYTKQGAEDFTPQGPYRWTPEKYRKKLHNMARVITQLGREHEASGVAALGVAEVENRRVLEDLVGTAPLSTDKMQIVHYDSPDRRGVDVALLYNPALFKYEASKPYRLVVPEDEKFVSRDQLLVSGEVGGDRVHVIVCHWPSRYGGGRSNPLRAAAARLTLHITDSLAKADPHSKIVVMGDLNDDPTNESTATVLGARRRASETAPGELFNTTWPIFDRGIGTLAYQGKWNLFDQVIVSQSALHGTAGELEFWRTEVFLRNFLLTPEGRRKGYPLRTFDGSTFINGYSDHLPVVIYFRKR